MSNNVFAAEIKNEGDSKAIWMFYISEIQPKSFVTETKLFEQEGNDYYRFKDISTSGAKTTFNQVFPSRGVSFYDICAPEETEKIIIDLPSRHLGSGRGIYTARHVSGDTFIINDTVKLWDNVITGYEAVEWIPFSENCMGTMIRVKANYKTVKKQTTTI